MLLVYGWISVIMPMDTCQPYNIDSTNHQHLIIVIIIQLRKYTANLTGQYITNPPQTDNSFYPDSNNNRYVVFYV